MLKITSGWMHANLPTTLLILGRSPDGELEQPAARASRMGFVVAMIIVAVETVEQLRERRSVASRFHCKRSER
jgi:hypothetical protein